MLRLATSRLSVRSSVPLAQIHNVLQGGPNLGRSLLYPVSMASFATQSNNTNRKNAALKKLVVEDQALESAKTASSDTTTVKDNITTEAQTEPMPEGKPATKFERNEGVETEKDRFKQDLIDGEWNSFVGGLSHKIEDENAMLESIKLEQEAYKKYTYSPAQLEDVLTKIKKSGKSKQVLMEMPDDVKKTWRAKWIRLYGVYVPTMVAIPCVMEFADMTALFAEKADRVVMVLTLIDCYTVGMSFMLYSFLKKLVTRVEYDTETQKVLVR